MLDWGRTRDLRLSRLAALTTTPAPLPPPPHVGLIGVDILKVVHNIQILISKFNKNTSLSLIRRFDSPQEQTKLLTFTVKRQYLLTLQLRRYCI